MRTIPLLLCFALAGCASFAAEEVQPVQPGTNANARAKADWWNDGTPMTRHKASAMCWMKFEKGRKDLPLEKRADLVNACVVETMKNPPT